MFGFLGLSGKSLSDAEIAILHQEKAQLMHEVNVLTVENEMLRRKMPNQGLGSFIGAFMAANRILEKPHYRYNWKEQKAEFVK